MGRIKKDLTKLSGLAKNQEIDKAIRKQSGMKFDTISKWLSRDYPQEVDKIIARKIEEKIKEHKNIILCTDYDADGICATVILLLGINELNPNAKVKYYIPGRFRDGYGLSQNVAQRVIEENPDGGLVITADNGINNKASIDMLQEHGFEVIVTDHHMLNPGNQLPDCYMVIDPVIEKLHNPLPGINWCGTAIVYMLFSQLDEIANDEELVRYMHDLAGIASVTDCIEMKDGTFKLVRETVENIQSGKSRTTLRNLLKTSGSKSSYFKDCTETSIGYQIGPKINAPGRLDDAGPELVVNYLMMKPRVKGIGKMLDELNAINDERKEISKRIIDSVEIQLEKNGIHDDRPIWVYVPPEDRQINGIMGLVAGELVKKYHLPVIVVTDCIIDGNKMLQGSGRSYGDYDLHGYLAKFEDKLYKWGGHKGACGVTLSEEAFKELQSTPDTDNIKNIEEPTEYEFTINKEDIPLFENILRLYRPFSSVNNPEPLFRVTVDLRIEYQGECIDIFGKNKKNMKLDHTVKNGYALTIFNKNIDEIETDKFDIIGLLSPESFMGSQDSALIAEEIYNDPKSESSEIISIIKANIKDASKSRDNDYEIA